MSSRPVGNSHGTTAREITALRMHHSARDLAPSFLRGIEWMVNAGQGLRNDRVQARYRGALPCPLITSPIAGSNRMVTHGQLHDRPVGWQDECSLLRQRGPHHCRSSSESTDAHAGVPKIFMDGHAVDMNCMLDLFDRKCHARRSSAAQPTRSQCLAKIFKHTLADLSSRRHVSHRHADPIVLRHTQRPSKHQSSRARIITRFRGETHSWVRVGTNDAAIKRDRLCCL